MTYKNKQPKRKIDDERTTNNNDSTAYREYGFAFGSARTA